MSFKFDVLTGVQISFFMKVAKKMEGEISPLRSRVIDDVTDQIDCGALDTRVANLGFPA